MKLYCIHPLVYKEYCKLLLREGEFMNPLILEIIQSIVVPEIAKFIKDYYEQNGTWPTKEDMEKKAIDLADLIVKQGELFLSESEGNK